jgi:hypothetical protein
VFENRVLGRIFGSRKVEVIGGWRKMHNEEFHILHSFPDFIRMTKSRRMTRVGQVACVGEMGNTDRILVGKPEGKRPLRRLRHRWEDNIKMDQGVWVGVLILRIGSVHGWL